MFGLSIWELLIILAIVLLLFGTKRLKNLGGDLGDAIKGFRSAVAEEEKPAAEPDPKIIEGEVTGSAQAGAKQNSDQSA